MKLYPTCGQSVAEDHKELIPELQKCKAKLKRVEERLLNEIAERKRVEEKLREAQEEAFCLGRLYEENPNPVLRVSADGIVLDRNPAAARVPGWACEVGQPQPSGLRHLVGQAIVDRKEAQEDLEMGGRPYIVWAVALPEKGYVSVYGRDISKRKWAEEELRLNMEHLHLALEASNSGVWEWDLRTNKNVWSEELWRIYGLEPHSCEPSYEAWRETIFPDDRAEVEHLAREAARKGTELNAEWRVRGLDGTERWVMSRGRPIRDADGRVIRFVGIVTDITKRKRTEEEVLRLNAALEAKVTKRTAQLEGANKALKDEIAERVQAEEEIRQSEREFRAIFELSSVGMAQRDSSTGLLIRVNQRLCEMTGYSVKELLNQKDIMLTHPDDRERDREVQAPVFKGECNTWFIEKRYIRKNGEVIWVLVNGRMIRDSSGRPFRTVAVIQEITSRKRAEEEILNLNEQVSKRALDLELANKELDSFTSAVSHDLKNQLIVISAFTERLIKRHMDKLDPKGQEYMRIINSSVENLTALVGDLLELSRLPKAKTKVETLNLSELVLSILKKYQEKDTARQVELLVPKKVEAQGDRRLLTVVLDNLLSNAWKYTKKLAAAQIEFGIIRDSETPIFFVRDNGCGFTVPADSDQVFLPFTRFHKVEEYPGTGVGLATVKRIISRHGGRIWVESSVGKGTIFYFTLQKIIK
jgi:PAS domain S-box-containing protein